MGRRCQRHGPDEELSMDAMPVVHPAVANSLDHWHQLVVSHDMAGLDAILADDAVFRSPMAHSPYPGAAAVKLILGTVIRVFEDFNYHRQLASADGLSVMLEFSAHVGGRQLKGIDLIRFNEQGKIVDFEVMVRPMSGLQALGEEMGRRLAPQLAALKG
jgi:ketosteroid isomerase-like protein